MKRKIQIYSLIITLIIFIGAGVIIGVNRGWFAGLADVVQPPGAAGQAKIKVSVYSGHPMEGNPLEGVRAYWREGEFNSGNQVCGTGQTDLSPYGGTQGGTTVKKADGVYSEFTINLEGNAGAVYYIRVDKDPFKSCAFYYFDTGGGRGNPEGVINNHAVKLSGLSSGDVVDLKFTTTTDVVSPPPVDNPPTTGTGALKGKVFDEQSNPVIGARVVVIPHDPVSGRGKTAVTNSAGEFSLTLNPGEYTVEIDKECFFNKITYYVRVVAGETTVVGGSTLIKLVKGGVPADKVKFELTVLDEQNDLPVEGAKLVLLNAQKDDVLYSGESEANGLISICPIIPREYPAKLTASGYRDYEGPADLISSGTTYRQTIKIKEGSGPASYTIKGKVRELILPAAGQWGEMYQWLEGAQVYVRPIKRISDSRGDYYIQEDIFWTAWTVSSGDFEVKGIPAPDNLGAEFVISAVKSDYQESSKIVRFGEYGRQPVIDIGDPPITLIKKDSTGKEKIKLRGRVHDQSRPVAGAEICLDDKVLYLNAKHTCEKIAVSSSDGSFSAELDSARWLLREVNIWATINQVDSLAGKFADGDNILSLGKEEIVDILFLGTAPYPATLTVEVVDDLTQQPIPQADIMLWFKPNDEDQGNVVIARGQTSMQGEAALNLFKPLKQAGKYTLQTFHQDYYKKIIYFSPEELEKKEKIKVELSSWGLSVEYEFEFFQRMKDDCPVGQGDLKNAFNSVINYLLGEPAATQIESDGKTYVSFPKINCGIIDISKWQFIFSGLNLGDNSNIKITWDPELAVNQIEWDGTFYIIVRFPDQATKEALADKIFADARVEVAPSDEDSQKISIDPGVIKQDHIGQNYIEYNVLFDFCFKSGVNAGDIILSLGEMLKSSGDKQSSLNTSPDQFAAWLKPINQSGSESPSAVSSSNIYQFRNGLLFTRLNPGRYKAVAKTGSYSVNSSKNSFEISPDNKISQAEISLCYSQDAYIESQKEDYKFIELGKYNYNLTSLLLTGARQAKTLVKKGGVNNLVFLTNTNERAVSYLDGTMSFCLEGQDKEITGRSLVFSDGYLRDITANLNRFEQEEAVASAISYQAGFLNYKDLEQISQKSFAQIFSLISSSQEREKIINFVSEASAIGKISYEVKNQASSEASAFYALNATAYKMNGEAMKVRINQEDNSETKNILKALVRFAIETQGANKGDEKLYEPAFNQKISETIYPASIIKSGSWMKDNYEKLGSAGKVGVRYWQILSRLRSSPTYQAAANLIASFNSWVDSIMGRRDSGTVNGTLLKSVGTGTKPVAEAVVTIGDKIGISDSKGKFKVIKVPVGTYSVEVKDRKTGKKYNLLNPNQKIVVRKNQTTTITIKVSD